MLLVKSGPTNFNMGSTGLLHAEELDIMLMKKFLRYHKNSPFKLVLNCSLISIFGLYAKGSEL